ncbi:hypothetical protein [Clostridium sp.]|uniref:hypothetical protein n=1 Tax=Clostridium sp. TaxID=1506 RepID=UPI003D6CE989
MEGIHAAKLLSYHSCRNNDVSNNKWKTGFLGKLITFDGVIAEDNFIEVMDCIKTLSTEFKKDNVNRELMYDVISIIYLGRCWTEKNNKVEPNILFSNKQSEKIAEWIDIIEDSIFHLLEGDYNENCN